MAPGRSAMTTRAPLSPDQLAGDGIHVGAVAGRPREEEGPRREDVRAGPAQQAERRLVRVDLEGVVARAAHRDKGQAVAEAEPATHGRDGLEAGREQVLGLEAAAGLEDVALRAVDLADLEGVVPLAAVEHDVRAGAIDRERVVAGEAQDEAPLPIVDAEVVVDPLDLLRTDRRIRVRVAQSPRRRAWPAGAR